MNSILNGHYPINLYSTSFVSIFENIGIKSVFGLFMQGVSFIGIRDIYIDLLDSPAALVSVIALLIVMDLASGILKSIKNSNFSPRMLRATIIKTIEYVIFLASITAISNAFSEYSDFAKITMPHVELSAYFIVTIIEMNSIVENLGIAGIGRAWKSIKEKYNIKKFMGNSSEK